MKRRVFLRSAGTFGLGTLLMPPKIFGQLTKRTTTWHIEQFQDKGLAHFSYAVLVGKKIILIDPSRDPNKYIDFVRTHGAEITGVIETHPHADFASSHLEFHRKHGAKIYASSLTKSAYPKVKFDEGSVIRLSTDISLRSLFTPGHAPDHIAVVLTEGDKDLAVFSGDALLIGDVGRPDLRDNHVDASTQRKVLANQLFDTIHHQFGKLADDVILYPAHGAGSLCGKAIRDASSSTIGAEKATNPAFQLKDRTTFVNNILRDLPFTPAYFSYDVSSNIAGLPDFNSSIAQVALMIPNFNISDESLIVDTRPQAIFKQSYQKGAINLQNGTKFETWLGSTISPRDEFYLIAADRDALNDAIAKTAKIGYERLIKGAFVYDEQGGQHFEQFDDDSFVQDQHVYTIIDVRTEREFLQEPILKGAINIPLQELKNRLVEIPKDKPILVNCASGYRSAAGSSIIKNNFPELKVLDFGASVTRFQNPGSEHNKHN